MIKDLPQELRDGGMINEDQYTAIEPIKSGKIVSVFYELRILLYLGVMLFSTGVGILIYENIGELGHLLAILLLCGVAGVCFWYVINKGLPYTNGKVKAPTPYFDYVLLLGCLLSIAIQGYVQFQYDLLANALEYSTLI